MTQWDLTFIQTFPHLFPKIRHPTRKMAEIAVNVQPSNILSVPNPDSSLIKLALSRDPKLIRDLQDHPGFLPEFLDFVLDLDPMMLKYVKNPTKEHIFKAIQKNGRAIEFVSYQVDAMKVMALRSNPECFPYIRNPSWEHVLFAVTMDANNYGHAKIYVKTPDDLYTLQKIVVTLNPRFGPRLLIQDHLKKIDDLAVTLDGYSYNTFELSDPSLFLKSLLTYPQNIINLGKSSRCPVVKLSRELELFLIRKSITMLFHLYMPDDETILEAILLDPNIINRFPLTVQIKEKLLTLNPLFIHMLPERDLYLDQIAAEIKFPFLNFRGDLGDFQFRYL